MLDIPIGGTIVPKEEIKKAPLLEIEVINILRFLNINMIGNRRTSNTKEHSIKDKCLWLNRI